MLVFRGFRGANYSGVLRNRVLAQPRPAPAHPTSSRPISLWLGHLPLFKHPEPRLIALTLLNPPET